MRYMNLYTFTACCVKYSAWVCMQVCVQSDDWKLADDMRPLQSDVVWMSDSAAEHARFDAVAYSV